MVPVPTLGSCLNSAQICRANQWHAGTMLSTPLLEPQEKRLWLQLTAVGDSSVLARLWAGTHWDAERVWNLNQRDWTDRVAFPYAAKSA